MYIAKFAVSSGDTFLLCAPPYLRLGLTRKFRTFLVPKLRVDVWGNAEQFKFLAIPPRPSPG